MKKTAKEISEKVSVNYRNHISSCLLFGFSVKSDNGIVLTPPQVCDLVEKIPTMFNEEGLKIIKEGSRVSKTPRTK
jgi:hypothetical protein